MMLRLGPALGRAVRLDAVASGDAGGGTPPPGSAAMIGLARQSVWEGGELVERSARAAGASGQTERPRKAPGRARHGDRGRQTPLIAERPRANVEFMAPISRRALIERFSASPEERTSSSPTRRAARER